MTAERRVELYDIWNRRSTTSILERICECIGNTCVKHDATPLAPDWREKAEERAEPVIMQNPWIAGYKLAEQADCTIRIIYDVRSRLRKEGKIPERKRG